MREILFRGKSKNGGQWFEGWYLRDGDEIDIAYPCTVEDDNFNSWTSFDYEDVIPETVGQYTGLKDKNGKKIFEGDVVSTTYTSAFIKNDKYLVNFSLDRGGWFPFASGDGCGCCEDHTYRPNGDGVTDLVILGNIYDNPELLEEVVKE